MNDPHLKARVLLKLPTTPFRDNFCVAVHPTRMRNFVIANYVPWACAC